MKKNILILINVTLILLFLSSCVKEKFDQPESDCEQIDLIANATIQDLKDYYNGSDTMKIDTNLTIKVTVISSDKEGNIYKELIVQDRTGGVAIQIDKKNMYETYPFGEVIFIKCKNLYLGKSGGIPALGSLYEEGGEIQFGRIADDGLIEEHIFKTCNRIPINPETYTIPELKANDTLLNTLVLIENVQFKRTVLGLKYADYDPYDPGSGERPIIDATITNEIILYNSGFSHFANLIIPEGNGSIVAIYGKYNSTFQLYINKVADVDFEGERFFDPYVKDFEDDDLNSGGWTTQVITGEGDWEVAQFSGNYYASMSNYNGSSNFESETWLISPSFDLSSSANPVLNFQSAWGYPPGNDLIVRYSTDYNGTSLPSTATWTELEPTFYTGSSYWQWTDSGNLILPTENNVYIAFIYMDGNSDGKTWEIDDITISDTEKQ